MNELIEKINRLKKEKNAVVLAHCYQNAEIDEVADFVGDSLYLSRMAKDTDADIIVFAGVSFMAETAKLLSPDKKVLFLPDTYLGKWVERQLGDVKVTTYPGFCPTHLQIKPEDIIKAKEKYPNAKVLAHPECHQEVVKLADYVGSTTGIMKYAIESDEKQFIIATEKGVVDRLQRDYNDKQFFLIKNSVICPNMKWHTLQDICDALENEQHEINVDEKIAKKAVKCINRMLEASLAAK